MVAACLVMLLLAALLVLCLGRVVHKQTAEGMETDRRLQEKKCWSCGASLVKMLPLVAIKIVLTVWQIVSQVNDTISTVALYDG